LLAVNLEVKIGEESRLTVHYRGRVTAVHIRVEIILFQRTRLCFFFMETGKVKVAIGPNLLLTCKQVTLPGLLWCIQTFGRRRVRTEVSRVGVWMKVFRQTSVTGDCFC